MERYIENNLSTLNEIVLYHHLGLGDHFTCNGLVNFISKHIDSLYLICKFSNFKTIKHLYEDNSTVKILPILNEPKDIFEFVQKENKKILRVGFEKTDLMNVERSFYDQLNLPYIIRFSEFKLPKNLDKSFEFYKSKVRQLGNDYIFVHNKSSEFRYNNLKIDSILPQHVCEVSDTDDILDYIHLMIHAKEIHVINSAIYCLMIGLHHHKMLTAEKIVFHNCRSLA